METGPRILPARFGVSPEEMASNSMSENAQNENEPSKSGMKKLRDFLKRKLSNFLGRLGFKLESNKDDQEMGQSKNLTHYFYEFKMKLKNYFGRLKRRWSHFYGEYRDRIMTKLMLNKYKVVCCFSVCIALMLGVILPITSITCLCLSVFPVIAFAIIFGGILGLITLLLLEKFLISKNMGS